MPFEEQPKRSAEATAGSSSELSGGPTHWLLLKTRAVEELEPVQLS